MRAAISLALLAAAVPVLPLAAQGISPEPETVLALAPAPRLPEVPLLRVEVPPPAKSASRRSPEEALTRVYLAALDELFAREPSPVRARELFTLRERVREAAGVVVR